MPKPNGTEDDDSKNIEDDESQNQGDETDDTSSQDDGEDEGNESSTLDFEDTDDPDELKEQLRKQQEHGTRMFERAKKAEGYKKVKDAKGKFIWVKKDGKPPEKKPDANKPPQNNQGNNNNQPSESLSEDDMFALVDAGVRTKEDRDMVKKYARANEMTISKALQEDIVRTTLANRAEERRTENATNTDKNRRGTSKQTGSSLLANAQRTGELPDSDEEMDRLVEERYKKR